VIERVMRWDLVVRGLEGGGIEGLGRVFLIARATIVSKDGGTRRALKGTSMVGRTKVHLVGFKRNGGLSLDEGTRV